MEDKNFPDAREGLERSTHHSDSVIKLIDVIKTSSGGPREDSLNQAFSTFDKHLAEAWLHLLPGRPGGAPQELDMSAQLANVFSDLKWLEEGIEQPQGGDREPRTRGRSAEDLMARHKNRIELP